MVIQKYMPQAVKRPLPEGLTSEELGQFIDDLDYLTRSIECNTYSNVYMLPKKGFAILKGRGVLPEFGSDLGQAAEMTSLKSLFKWRLQAYLARTVKVAYGYWVTDIWSFNYYHWFVDALPRAKVLFELKGDVPLVFSSYYDNSFVRGSLAKLGFTQLRFLSANESALFEHLYVVSRASHRDHAHPALIKKLRSCLRQELPSSDRLYIRRIGNSRSTVNEDEVTNFFRKLGFNILEFESLSWNEQVEAASKASIMVSNHGAGLTNMLFMKPGTTVIELRSFRPSEQNCFYRLACSLDLRYHPIFCKAEDKNCVQSKLIVPLGQLDDLIKRIC